MMGHNVIILSRLEVEKAICQYLRNKSDSTHPLISSSDIVRMRSKKLHYMVDINLCKEAAK